MPKKWFFIISAKRNLSFGIKVDKVAVKDILNELDFPIYSLDFETYQAVIPEYDGIATYEQVPFQYSLKLWENLFP